MADVVVVEMQKQTRRSFTHEFKFRVVEWYFSNSKKILQTTNKFKIDKKQASTWIAGEENIK